MTETKKKEATRLLVAFPHKVNGKLVQPGETYDSPSDEWTRTKIADGHVQVAG